MNESSTEVPCVSLAILNESSWSNQVLIDVYGDLRRFAKTLIWKEAPGLTLQPTDLVHDAYLRLVTQTVTTEWTTKGHYFVAAAEAMRRILIERARRKKTTKHGGECQRISISEAEAAIAKDDSVDGMLELDEAFQSLEQDYKQAAEIAKLRVFAGLTLHEIAQSLSLPQTTVFRNWHYARAFLIHRMRPEQT